MTNEDQIREQQLADYLEQQEVTCPLCEVPFERGYDDANAIESNGACPDCQFDVMLREKEARRRSTGKIKRPVRAQKKERQDMATATKEEKKPAAPIVKVKYSETPITWVPGASDEEGGFNPSRHRPLSEEDFASLDVFYDWSAAKAQRTADKFTAKAEMARKYGDPKKMAAAKKVEAFRKKMATMEAKLMEQVGEDLVAELMAEIS